MYYVTSPLGAVPVLTMKHMISFVVKSLNIHIKWNK